MACVNCHRRSGLGGHEGRTSIPPVAGPYLFHSDPQSSQRGGLPYAEGVRPDREPYSDATLARAIRDGVDSSGKSLSYLMPRYALGDADMAALIAYLKTLDPRRQPGVSGAVLHLATIFTPDADPVKQQGVLDVMRQFVAERNARQRAPGPQLMTSERAMLSKSMFRPVRQWELHVWQLRGRPRPGVPNSTVCWPSNRSLRSCQGSVAAIGHPCMRFASGRRFLVCSRTSMRRRSMRTAASTTCTSRKACRSRPS